MRHGVTMLELLVVLVLMAISAALVVPALRPRTEMALALPDGLPPSALDAVIADARRLAVKRGQPLHLRVANDGVWAVAPEAGGGVIRDGRVSGALSWIPDITVDAMGVCALYGGVVPPQSATAWDALQCRWRIARTNDAETRGARS